MLIVGGAIAMYYVTKPKDLDFTKFYMNNKKSKHNNVSDAKHDADGVVAKSDKKHTHS